MHTAAEQPTVAKVAMFRLAPGQFVYEVVAVQQGGVFCRFDNPTKAESLRDYLNAGGDYQSWADRNLYRI